MIYTATSYIPIVLKASIRGLPKIGLKYHECKLPPIIFKPYYSFDLRPHHTPSGAVNMSEIILPFHHICSPNKHFSKILSILSQEKDTLVKFIDCYNGMTDNVGTNIRNNKEFDDDNLRPVFVNMMRKIFDKYSFIIFSLNNFMVFPQDVVYFILKKMFY
jgi:hypothetical protein